MDLRWRAIDRSCTALRSYESRLGTQLDKNNAIVLHCARHERQGSYIYVGHERVTLLYEYSSQSSPTVVKYASHRFVSNFKANLVGLSIQVLLQRLGPML